VPIGRVIRPLEAYGAPADTELVRVRLRSEAGFGLVELLMAMVMLNVGILAIVAAFNSGIFALNRASRISTASALADAQMELYRAFTYSSIALDSTSLGSVDNTYRCDSALGGSCPNSTSGEVTGTCSGSPVPNECTPSRIVTGADRKSYRVDTYIQMSTASTNPPTPANGRAVKIVTVVVRNAAALSARPFARLSSTFDQSTG
jgi:type II secretory pathway pseudopilin PulG